MSREYPDRPIVGVGVVVLKADRVLMIKRGREPRIGQWSIPGGKQRIGETWQEAAVREVREETGVEIEVLGIVDVVDAIVRDGDPPRPGTVRSVGEPPARAAPANDDIAATVVPIMAARVRYHYTLIDCAALWTEGEPVAGGDAAHAEWWQLDRLSELPLWTETVRIITGAAEIAAARKGR